MDAKLTKISRRYRRFADEEARGASPRYEALSRFASESVEVLAFLAALPAERQQPNLFLAALRQVAGVPRDGYQVLETIRQRGEQVRRVMLSRTTQTNEPARCAVLLPVLAQLPQPLAVIEVGASAGLCLLADYYGYDYGRVRLAPRDANPLAPVFPCDASAATPLPDSLPEIVWRAGIDLNPIDLTCEADVGWLETLVWPEQKDRASRLRRALEVARRYPPEVIRGNLLSDLPALLDRAPAAATLVVFHTAVLAYVADPDERQRSASDMLTSNAVWISNEAPAVFSRSAALSAHAAGRFLLSVDGEPTAWTHPHGQAIEWLHAGR